MSISDIKIQLEELYAGAEISESLISNITTEVMSEVTDWQNRQLDPVYPIVFIDCLVVKVKQDGKIINKSVYIVLGVNKDGIKEVLGLWIDETESAKFWLNVLTELKNRGLHDILILCSDNLYGMKDAVIAVYPKTEHQLCIVHQIRNTLKYVSYKNKKAVVAELKAVYTANTEKEALAALKAFEDTWGEKYPNIAKSWRTHWDNLAVFLQYPHAIRKVIYTTNPIESFNSQLRKCIV